MAQINGDRRLHAFCAHAIATEKVWFQFPLKIMNELNLKMLFLYIFGFFVKIELALVGEAL